MERTKKPFSSKSIVMTAEEMGNFGFWWKNLLTSEEYWSPGMYRILSHTPSNGQISLSNLLNQVHPFDRERLASIITSEVHHVSVDSDFRILLGSGLLRWIGLKSQYNHLPYIVISRYRLDFTRPVESQFANVVGPE